MEKIIRIGKIKNSNVFCKIQIKEKEKGKALSISGVIGPRTNGDCSGSCGQIDDEIAPENITEYAPGWDAVRLMEFIDIWKKWHLNDMRAGCEHQRSLWNVDKELTLLDFSWGDVFHNLRKKVEDGQAPIEEYNEYVEIRAQVYEHSIEINHPRYMLPETQSLIDRGYLKIVREQKKNAQQVHYKEHPEGLLTRPCIICGYRYGTSWLHEPLPESVISFLESLPDTDVKPAWV